jgi:carbamoyltransferase
MSVIIGLNAFHADSAAAIIKNNELLFAIEEEKLNRIKHWAGFPILAIAKCLEQTSISSEEVTDISINTNPYSNLKKKIPFFLKNFLFGNKKYEIFNRTKNKFKLRALFNKNFNFIRNVKIHFVDHHLSHISSAYYASNFDESLCISVDGFGDFESVAIAKCIKSKIQIIDKVFFPHSLGIFYEMMTQALGFKNYGDEYKIMGLASYGKPIYFDLLKENLFNEKNILSLNLNYFNHTKNNFSYKFNGSPTQNELYNENLLKLFPNNILESEKTNIASSVQKLYEFVFFKIIKHSLKLYSSKNLCLAGGCALNSSANGKITENFKFNNIFIPYAPSDAGGAIGSAFYIGKKINPDIEIINCKNPFLGPSYKNSYIKNLTAKLPINKFLIEEINNDEELHKIVAQKISEGKIVGWFQGRAEFGARALGNRSILADPRRSDIRDIINTKIKKREDFRPFAPSILSEFKDEWFETVYKNYYMESVIKLKNNKKNIIPAVTHIDGTCRLQGVYKELNPRFYNLIKCFYLITNVPIILNTSFNENEPMVCAPEEAINCFERTNMDCLVIENQFINRII